MGNGHGYGFLYGDTFDGAQLKYQNDKFAATAGYGKFKVSDLAGTADQDGVKTGYGELDGFFGGGRMAGSALAFTTTTTLFPVVLRMLNRAQNV